MRSAAGNSSSSSRDEDSGSISRNGGANVKRQGQSSLRFKINDFSKHDLATLPVVMLLHNSNRPAHVQQVWRARECDFGAREFAVLFKCLPHMCKNTLRGELVPESVSKLLLEGTSALLRSKPACTPDALAAALWAVGRLRIRTVLADRLCVELNPHVSSLSPEDCCAVMQARARLNAPPSDPLCLAVA